ncbi:MAG TPA: hypothetical protein VMU97_02985 [Candidatus Dormibacteraeota bacterium]|nr:hypothetical protein [Candidatus Dormibacteraeota bacterium]
MAGESLQVYDWQVEQVFSDVIIQPAESQHTKINADLSDARLQGGLGRVCDAVVKNGLRFTQQSNGSYSLDTVQRKFTPEPDLIPAWMAAAVWSNVPQEVPHHNPAFVSTTATTGIDEAKQKYVGYDNIKAVGRVFGLDVRSLRSSLIHALR